MQTSFSGDIHHVQAKAVEVPVVMAEALSDLKKSDLVALLSSMDDMMRAMGDAYSGKKVKATDRVSDDSKKPDVMEQVVALLVKAWPYVLNYYQQDLVTRSKAKIESLRREVELLGPMDEVPMAVAETCQSELRMLLDNMQNVLSCIGKDLEKEQPRENQGWFVDICTSVSDAIQKVSLAAVKLYIGESRRILNTNGIDSQLIAKVQSHVIIVKNALQFSMIKHYEDSTYYNDFYYRRDDDVEYFSGIYQSVSEAISPVLCSLRDGFYALCTYVSSVCVKACDSVSSAASRLYSYMTGDAKLNTYSSSYAPSTTLGSEYAPSAPPADHQNGCNHELNMGTEDLYRNQ